MGAGASQALEPEELTVFKKLPYGTPLDNITIPEREQYRKLTDLKFLIIFIVFIVALVPFLAYALINSDINRLIVGYDECGNVCGQKNAKYDQWSCTGEDFTDKKYLQIERSGESHKSWWLEKRECVRECSDGYSPFGWKCEKRKRFHSIELELDTIDPNDDGKDVSTYFKTVAWRLVLCIALSVVVAMLMIFLFRTQTAAVVWGILGGCLLFGLIIVGAVWFFYFKSSMKDEKQSWLILGIIFTIFWLALLCVVIFLHRKINLVIQILKEATKAAIAMPCLIFTPVLSFLGILIVVFCTAVTTFFMSSSARLHQVSNGFLHWDMDTVAVVAIVFNIIICYWAIQFIIGIQYMVIAGAVSKWYFAQNKDHLGQPIGTSARIVFKFHLGSIAFGSMIITLIVIIRTLIQSLTKNKGVKACIDCIMEPIERFLKFLTKNAYIITAMHGKPFYKSGKRAAKIIFQNAINVASINYIGDFVLGMAQLLIIIITMLITFGIMQGVDAQYSAFGYLIVFVAALLIAITSFAIFETVVDTILICFCEDQLLNDGMARPYFMSRNLMEFVENSKKIYGEPK